MDGMYENIGGKIKGLAKVMAVLGAIGSLFAGITLMAEDDDLILIGLLTAVFGVLFSWVSTWLLYGFGELIDNTESISNACGNISYKMSKSENQQISGRVGIPYSHGPAMSQAMPANGWQCSCGRVHPSYETSCVCGATKQMFQQQ